MSNFICFYLEFRKINWMQKNEIFPTTEVDREQ